MKVKHYRELLVWQKSMELTKAIYQITSGFPNDELYGLTSQMRRCAVSVPSNIAEGHNRDSIKDYLRFLSIAQGSLAELETQVSLAQLMDYIAKIKETQLLQRANEIGKMLRGLQLKLHEKILEPSP